MSVKCNLTNYEGGNRGFTLIEILVVIFITLALGTIVITSISSSRMKSRDSVRISDIGSLRLALEHFYDTCGRYPNTLALDEGQQSGEIYCPTSVQFGTFIKVIPTDPSTGAGYYYYASGSGAKCYRYHIGATLENTTHAELANDSDIVASPGTACTGGGTFTSGADPVYDGDSNL